MPKKSRDVWKLKEYNKCYCYERYGNVYTYVFGIKKATDLTWIPENKQRALQILNERVRKHYDPDKIEYSLYDLLDDYKRNKMREMSQQSQKKLNEVFKWVFNMSDFNLNQTTEIRNAILKNFENHQLSNSTKSKYLGYISSVFNYGIDNHFLEHNPINKSIIPKAIHKEIISFSPEEVEAILKMLLRLNKEITYGVVLFSRYFGTRISETLSLKWSNINHEDIKFIRKGGKTARLPYDKFDRIINWINSQPRSNDKLFNITSQKAGLHLKLAIHSINNDPNINMMINDTLSFHAIRKMRENELIKLYKNEPKVVADFMGHTLAIQQKHYLTVFESDELREKLKFE
ncbi:MAG: hypothetical protein NTW25_07740 [Candidatus Kapabacteria bacterium]|nr:hypothetical protein [Candidatus Kapabacteria bacterium]